MSDIFAGRFRGRKCLQIAICLLLRRQAAVDAWSRFCVANAGGGLAWGLHLHGTPCAFRYPFIEVRTYGLVRRGVPAFGGYRATHAMCMLATFQVEGSAPLRGADLSSCK